jgi:hypothetical protein
LTIAEDELVYKLGLEVEISEAGTEESSEDPIIIFSPLHIPPLSAI